MNQLLNPHHFTFCTALIFLFLVVQMPQQAQTYNFVFRYLNKTTTSTTTTTTTTLSPNVNLTNNPVLALNSTISQNLNLSSTTTAANISSINSTELNNENVLTPKHATYNGGDYFNPRCPAQSQIHPCKCMLVDVREEVTEDDESNNQVIDEYSEHIETVAHCENIRHVQVLHQAIRGFVGHRVNSFVIDSCVLPPFPNQLFKGIKIKWMEIINSAVQFQEEFFDSTKV